MHTAARKLAIGISSFRSDKQALALVKKIVELQIDFEWLFVVDSQGSEELGQRIADIGDPRIRHYAEQKNIGSAGNLCRRLEISSQLGADWLLAFNHDAPVSAPAVAALLAVASEAVDWGALYPLRFEEGRGRYDLSGTRWFPYGFRGVLEPPKTDLTPVYWGSSNGALYSLAAVRKGIIPQASLWMGWEDYLFGLTLERAGWHQWLIRNSEIGDSYEFRKRGIAGVELTVSDKPCWYYYYAVRNLILSHVHLQPSMRGMANLAAWLPVYGLRVIAFPGQCSRRRAFLNFLEGLVDGIMGRKGKWRLP